MSGEASAGGGGVKAEATEPKEVAEEGEAGNEALKMKEGFVGKVSTWWKVAYGLPGFATTSLSFLIAVYANDFYTMQGTDLAFLSFFTALARSFDVLTDPVMGWFSDKTRTRYGRRRPFMLIGSFFYAILFVALFTPPRAKRSDDDESENIGAAYWFGFFYTSFYLFDTFSNVPYEALGPELSDDYHERNNIFFVAKLFNFVGMLFAAAAPAAISYVLRRPGKGYFDCRDVYSESTPPVEGEVPVILPQFEQDGICQNMTKCVGSEGRVCFEKVLGEDKSKFLEVELEVLQRCKSGIVALGNSTFDCFEGLESGCQDEAARKLLESQCVPLETFSVSDLEADRTAFFICATIFGVYYVTSILNCVFVIRERKLGDDAAVPVPLVPSILRAFKNRAFRPLLAAWALDGLALASLVTMFPFFIRYVVVSDGVKAQEAETAMDPVMCMGFSVMGLLLAAVLSAPVWLYIGKRYGKYYAWMIYNIVSVVTNLLFFIPSEGDPVQTIMVMVVNGIPVGGQFLTNSVLADVIDYDEFLNGSRSEGSFSVFATLIPKFVAIPASALPLAIINILGFKPPINGVSQPQDDLVKTFIRMTFVLLPLLSATVGTFFKFIFPIKKQSIMEEIQEGIAKHHRDPSEAHPDPITGKDVKLMELTDDEARVVWLYENFSSKCLRHLVDKRTAQPVVIEMGLYFGFGTVLTLSLLVATIGTFGLIRDRKKSIIPVALVILFGMALSFTLVHLGRFLAALKLRKGDFENHINLIHRLSRFKLKGQRGGSLSDDKPMLVDVAYSLMSSTDNLKKKYATAWLKHRPPRQPLLPEGSPKEEEGEEAGQPPKCSLYNLPSISGLSLPSPSIRFYNMTSRSTPRCDYYVNSEFGLTKSTKGTDDDTSLEKYFKDM